MLIHRQPDNIWRIDYQLREGESAEEATREEEVRASVASVLKEIGHEGAWELEWWSVYSANTLALDDYRDGRVFFIGDSAHIVPIFVVSARAEQRAGRRAEYRLETGLGAEGQGGRKPSRQLHAGTAAARRSTFSPTPRNRRAS